MGPGAADAGAVGAGNDAPEGAALPPVVVLLVNMLPNPILERVSWDSSVRRYAGPSDIFLE